MCGFCCCWSCTTIVVGVVDLVEVAVEIVSFLASAAVVADAVDVAGMILWVVGCVFVVVGNAVIILALVAVVVGVLVLLNEFTH